MKKSTEVRLKYLDARVERLNVMLADKNSSESLKLEVLMRLVDCKIDREKILAHEQE